MEPKKDTARPIIDQVHEYVETRLKLLKLEAIDRGATIVSAVIVDLVMIISLVLTFLFASFTLALFLGDLLGANWRGFGCVAVLYLLIALVIIFAKKSIERPIINALIKKLF